MLPSLAYNHLGEMFIDGEKNKSKRWSIGMLKQSMKKFINSKQRWNWPVLCPGQYCCSSWMFAAARGDVTSFFAADMHAELPQNHWFSSAKKVGDVSSSSSKPSGVCYGPFSALPGPELSTVGKVQGGRRVGRGGDGALEGETTS